MVIIAGLQYIGSSSSGLGALGVNGSAFIIQLITFILGYLVLRKFAFGPIVKILKQRRETIDQAVTLGEEMKKEKQKLEERVTKELSEARTKADVIIADAEESAKDSIREAEAKALAKADIILKEAKLKTEQDMASAKRSLEHEITALVAEATEVLTGEKVDTKKDAGIINKALQAQVKS